MTSSQDAKGQPHIAAASRKEVEEESLLDAHTSVEQDNEVSYNRGENGKGVESGHGTLMLQLRRKRGLESQAQGRSWDEGTSTFHLWL